MTVIDRWHDYIQAPTRDALLDLLDPDATFDSPVVHATQHGRDITAHYLTNAVSVLAGPNFRYIGEWRTDEGAVLEFLTEIEGIIINGVDIIRLTADRQRIASFKVMIRPMKAVNLIHRLMGERLARSA